MGSWCGQISWLLSWQLNRSAQVCYFEEPPLGLGASLRRTKGLPSNQMRAFTRFDPFVMMIYGPRRQRVRGNRGETNCDPSNEEEDQISDKRSSAAGKMKTKNGLACLREKMNELCRLRFSRNLLLLLLLLLLLTAMTSLGFAKSRMVSRSQIACYISRPTSRQPQQRPANVQSTSVNDVDDARNAPHMEQPQRRDVTELGPTLNG